MIVLLPPDPAPPPWGGVGELVPLKADRGRSARNKSGTGGQEPPHAGSTITPVSEIKKTYSRLFSDTHKKEGREKRKRKGWKQGELRDIKRPGGRDLCRCD